MALPTARSHSPTHRYTKTLAFDESVNGGMAGCLEGVVYYLPPGAPPSARVRLVDFDADVTNRVVVNIVTMVGCPFEYIFVGQQKRLPACTRVFRVRIDASPYASSEVEFEAGAKLPSVPRFASALMVSSEPGQDKILVALGLGNMSIHIHEIIVDDDCKAINHVLGKITANVTAVSLAVFADAGNALLTMGSYDNERALTRWSVASMIERGTPFSSRANDAKKSPDSEVASEAERIICQHHNDRYECKYNFTPKELAKKEKNWQDVFPAVLISDPGEYHGEVNSDGQPHGRGSITDIASGSVYEGMWSRGRREGSGEERSNDSIFKGRWINDRRDGFGVMTILDLMEIDGDMVSKGDMVECFYRNGRMNGITRWHVRDKVYIVQMQAGHQIRRMLDDPDGKRPDECWICLRNPTDFLMRCPQCDFRVHEKCALDTLTPAQVCPFRKCNRRRMVKLDIRTLQQQPFASAPVVPAPRRQHELGVIAAKEFFGAASQRLADREINRYKVLRPSLYRLLSDKRSTFVQQINDFRARADLEARRKSYQAAAAELEKVTRDLEALGGEGDLSRFDQAYLEELQKKVQTHIFDVLSQVKASAAERELDR